jgi:dTDP-glucose pyrophosphorylase
MFKEHLIGEDGSVREALGKLNGLALDAILFVVDKDRHLLGSLTDGDLRRGFLRGLELSSSLLEFIQPNPVFIKEDNYTVDDIRAYRKKYLKIIPVVDEDNRIISIINLRLQRGLLPLDAIIMAGGEGQRLKPLTDYMPKPLLRVGDKPIIEHNVDRLISYGVKNIYISIRYLGQQIVDYFGDGKSKGIHIQYIWEDEPLGTLGSVCKAEGLKHDQLLVMNSDLLTNIDFEDLFATFNSTEADLTVATIPYQVKVPYAVLQTNNAAIVSFEEKPTYTYYSNAGIYLMKKVCIDLIPNNCSYDATDLINELIQQGKKVTSSPILGYWLDIGRPEDFAKAQIDIQHLNFY